MIDLPQELARFLGASLIQLPIAALAIWGVFSIMKRNSISSLFLASVIVGAAWTILHQMRTGTDIQLIYWWLDIAICFLAGFIVLASRRISKAP
jgi:hypothetical protein